MLTPLQALVKYAPDLQRQRNHWINRLGLKLAAELHWEAVAHLPYISLPSPLLHFASCLRSQIILELQRLVCSGRPWGVFQMEQLQDCETKAEHYRSTWWGQRGSLQPASCLQSELKYWFPQSAKDEVKKVSALAILVCLFFFLQMIEHKVCEWR